MAKSVLDAEHFKTEEAAFAYVESKLWPDGPICPFCGERERVGVLKGKTTRPGLRKCYACKKPFTVRIGTIFESSHLALHLWLQVIHLMCASKKGVSTRQIQRMLQCSMKTAWFLTHRIREAMKPVGRPDPMGGDGAIIEMDEVYIGKSPFPSGLHARNQKNAVVSLIERGGRMRSTYMPVLRKADVHDLVRHHVSPKAHLNTDESRLYFGIEQWVASHATVNHTYKEYVRGTVTTNTVEGAFGLFKRGMVGTYQHCGVQHLQRYLNEFDFRYSNRAKLGIDDVSRAEIALKGFKGKRLTYETTSGRQ